MRGAGSRLPTWQNLSPYSCPKWYFWKDPLITIFIWEELSLEPLFTDLVTLQTHQGDSFGLFLGPVSPSRPSRAFFWAAWATSPLCSLSLTSWICEGTCSFAFRKSWVQLCFNRDGKGWHVGFFLLPGAAFSDNVRSTLALRSLARTRTWHCP